MTFFSVTPLSDQYLFSLLTSDWQVQTAVHGVTLEECQAALQTHSWSVPQAVNHLKVSAWLHAFTLKSHSALVHINARARSKCCFDL